jgi:hypothetical protein
MAEVLITYKAENESLQAVVKETVKGNIAISESATKAGKDASKAYKDAANAAKAAFASEEVKKALDNQVKGVDKLKQGIKDLRKESLEIAKALGKESEAYKNNIKATAELKLQIDKLKKAEKENNTTTEEAIVKSISLKTQLKNLKAEISALDAAGKSGSKQFNDLAISAARLEDQIGDTAQRVKVLASDTFKFDAAIGAVKGLAAGFAVAQGAVGLFAKDNEELQMAIAKTNSAIAILTGLQEIANIVTGQGAEKLGALALAQGAYNFVVGTSTGLTKAFRIALAATGIGLVVYALIALIENFDKVSDAISGASATSRALSSTLEETKTAMSKATEETSKVGNAFELAKKGVISKEEALLIYNETLGDSFGKTNNLNKAEQNFIDKKDAYILATGARAQAQALLAKSAALAVEATTVTAKEARNLGEDIQKVANKIEESLITPFASFGKSIGVASAETSIAIDANNKLIDKNAIKRVSNDKLSQSKLLGNLALSKSEEAAIIEKGAGIISEAQQKINDKAAEAAKKAAEDAKNAREKLAQAELDILSRSLDEQGKVLDESNKEILALEATFREAKFKKGSAEEIEQEKKKQNSIEEIKKQATAKNIELEKQAQEKILAAKLEAAKLAESAVADAELAIRKKVLIETEILQEQGLKTFIDVSNAKIDVLKQEAVIAKASVQNQSDEALKRVEKGSKEEIDIKNNTAKQIELIDATLQQNINTTTQKGIEDTTKLRKEENQKQIDLILEYAMAVGNALMAVNDLQKQLAENRIADINLEKETQLNAINESFDTERSKIRQRAALELRANRAIAAEKTKQAKADKALALFNAVIGTAAAVATAKTVPLKILAGIVGAAQIAIILARPIPKFAQGGVVGGQLHSQGGTQIEAEKDEYIVKRSQSVKHRKELDAINTSTQAFRNMINERYVRPAIMNYVLNRKQEQGVTVNASLNSKAMESELRGLRKDIRNSRVRSINTQLDSRYTWQ